jgi:hypothetical protein
VLVAEDADVQEKDGDLGEEQGEHVPEDGVPSGLGMSACLGADSQRSALTLAMGPIAAGSTSRICFPSP